LVVVIENFYSQITSSKLGYSVFCLVGLKIEINEVQNLRNPVSINRNPTFAVVVVVVVVGSVEDTPLEWRDKLSSVFI